MAPATRPVTSPHPTGWPRLLTLTLLYRKRRSGGSSSPLARTVCVGWFAGGDGPCYGPLRAAQWQWLH